MTVGAWIDWANDGFGTGTYDDVTANVLSWTITRGSTPEITGQASPGAATVILKDPSGLYNPSNSGSPIFSYLRDGPSIWIGVNQDGTLGAGGTVSGLFGGRITDITPIPAGGFAEAPTVEILCEDALTYYGRQTVQIADSTTRSQGSLRADVLTAIGETHTSLAPEIATLPLSSASGDALSVLTGLNAANGTRHWIKPGATPTAWYTYTTRDRMAKLDGSSDASLSATSQYVTKMDGWRKTAATVINEQIALVTPISFPIGLAEVWAATTQTLPIVVASGTPQTVWANFADFVTDPVVIEQHTGSSLTVTSTFFGTAAKIVLTSSGTTTVTALSVNGRQVVRDPSLSIVVDDTSSQAAPRGIRSGPQIQGDFVGTSASALGIAEHMVWRYAQPLFRPTVTVENWFPQMFTLDLFDVIALTSTQLHASGELMEITGLQHQANIAAPGAVHHVVTYTLQQSRVQTTTHWFTADVSVADGTDILGY